MAAREEQGGSTTGGAGTRRWRCICRLPVLLELSSDLAHALALQVADLARAEQVRHDAQACYASHARSAASVCIAAHDALFACKLAAILEGRWARDGDYFERPWTRPSGGVDRGEE